MNPAPSTELAAALTGLRPHFRRAAIFGVMAGLLVLAPSAYMLEVYDRVVTSRNLVTLAMLTLLVLWCYAVMEALEWSRAQIMHGASLAFERKLGDRIFGAMFWAKLRSLPGASVQAMNDFRTVREFITSSAVKAIIELPVSAALLAVVFLIDSVLGWAALVGAALLGCVAWLNERATQPPLSAANRSAIQAQTYVDGTLRNAEVIEAMGMQRDIHRRWMAKQREFLGLQALASDRAGSYQSVSKFLQLLQGSVIMGLGAWLILTQEMKSPALMIVASILGSRVVAPIAALITQWRSVVAMRGAWARLTQLLSAIPPKENAMPLPAPHGLVHAEAIVSAAPGTNVPILKGISFALHPGEVLAVAGPSASGKSSLARALVGLWPTAGGKVRLDGADVFAWDKEELGPHIGYLPQEVELFDGTIADNIARFGEVDPEKLEAAARLVGLHEYIVSLSEGYDTPVGGEGAMLSGGQRQRVALARAIYGNPVFVVLDEPNSSLDEAGEAALAAAIRELKARGTTFVVMTHRTSILAVADKLLMLREGQTQAFGPRDEVLAALAKAAQQAQQALSGQQPAGKPGQPQLAGAS